MLDRLNPKVGNLIVEEANPAVETSEVTLPSGRAASLPGFGPAVGQVRAKCYRALVSPWAGAVLVLAGLVAIIAYQFTPVMFIKLGGGYDRPYLNLAEGGFDYAVRFDYDDGQSILVGSGSQSANAEAGDNPAGSTQVNPRYTGPEPITENYRWTRIRPILLLSGVGPAAKLELRAAASPLYPAGQKVDVLLNGQAYTSFVLVPGLPQNYRFDLNQAAYPYQNGNLAVEMRVSARDPADSALNLNFQGAKEGFKLYDVWLTPNAAGLVPPPTIALFLALAALGFYFALAYLGQTLGLALGLARPLAFGTAALLLVGAGLMLAVWRLEFTGYSSRLALLLVVAALALPLLDLSLPRLFRLLHRALPRYALNGLLVLFLAGLLLRGAGLLYPQAVVIDSPAHLLEINKVAHGQLLEEYFNRDLSKVPGQWKSAAVIPYSTISYFLLAPFARLPFDQLVSLNLVNVLLDALRVFIIYALAQALGMGSRQALIGAGLYLLVPCTWLMNSWGPWPTTLSFWFAVLYLTLALVLYSQLGERRVWLGLTALLTLTMLIYSVTAVFMGLLLLLWAAWLFFDTGRRKVLDRKNARLLFGQVGAASLLAIGLYYWQFLPDLTTTLTSFNQSLDSGAGLGLGQRDFLPYLGLYTDHLFNWYGIGALLVLAVAFYSWIILAPAARPLHLTEPSQPEAVQTEAAQSDEFEPAILRSGRNVGFVGAWFAVFVLFGLAQWKVDMVDKQVWFIVPLVCGLAGGAIWFLWQQAWGGLRRYGTRLAVVALTGWLTYSTASLWIYRIFFKRH